MTDEVWKALHKLAKTERETPGARDWDALYDALTRAIAEPPGPSRRTPAPDDKR
ncbi:MAG: hypothetical protein ACRCU1_15220 [Alsobacter sp.]